MSKKLKENYKFKEILSNKNGKELIEQLKIMEINRLLLNGGFSY